MFGIVFPVVGCVSSIASFSLSRYLPVVDNNDISVQQAIHYLPPGSATTCQITGKIHTEMNSIYLVDPNTV